MTGSAVLAFPPLAKTALAHHGWSWTEDGFFRLEGTILELYIGNPHATLSVDADGEIWHVDLAPPSRTIAAGFTENVASPGDEVIAVGNRSKDPDEKSMKASRITVNGRHYDVYPRRVPAG
ncbi:MAG: DUF6152 family protein [Pseudomonadota bacterium]|nr:DUF6152 family protein [Pseudomonadota bacterium]